MATLPDRHDPPSLPEQGRSDASDARRLAKASLPRSLAKVLDEWFTIPGTRIKVGLDPIIGFAFQALGDAAAAVAGALILREALVRGVPLQVLLRMSANLLINAGLGAVPLVGDAFSIWFKSNTRNFILLQRHTGHPDDAQRKPSIWPVVAILSLALALIAAMATGIFFLGRALFS